MEYKMNTLKRITSTAILTAMTAVSIFGYGTNFASAKNNNNSNNNSNNNIITYRGDINFDNSVSVSDIVLLQKHLLKQQTLKSSQELERADLNNDSNVNAIDLSILKACVSGNCELIEIKPDTVEETTEPVTTTTTPLQTTSTTSTTTTTTTTEISTEVTTTTTHATTTTTTESVIDLPFIPAYVSKIGASLPSQGDSQLVVFYVDFPDCTYSNKLSTQELQEISFGDEDTSSSYYPFESMTAFYKRSSKGALNLGGQVFSYTAKNSISYYNDNKVALAEECFEAFKDSADFSKFDSDGDGMIDATVFTVPESADENYWWPCAGAFGDDTYSVDGVKVGHIITGNADPVDISNYNSSYLHEMGHCMGLPDYYLYTSSDDFYGMNGDAGGEMMNDAITDFGAVSKIMLGWYKENQVSVYDTSLTSQTFTLSDAETENGNCVIIPYGDFNDDYYSEYFVVEYTTDTVNNTGSWYHIGNGVRIYHVDAEVMNNGWWTFFKYESGSEYTNSDAGRRFIRLVNNGTDMTGDNFFKTGDVIDSSVSGFAWYDSNGKETVDTNLSISIDDFSNGEYTITITQK
jgi:M6 family metalloprotease-like protein